MFAVTPALIFVILSLCHERSLISPARLSINEGIPKPVTVKMAIRVSFQLVYGNFGNQIKGNTPVFLPGT